MNVPPPDRNLIEEVALIKGISPSFAEKDWYVTQVIKIVSEISFRNFQIIFTGGTSLSKAYRLLQRFSEDIDFRVIVPDLKNESKSKQRKILSEFKEAVTDVLQKTSGIAMESIFARSGNQFMAFEITYPAYYSPETALRPHILVEFTVSDLVLPASQLPISSLVNEVSKKMPEIERIGCTDIVENTCDKLSAITWRIPDRVRGEEKDDPAIVRHIHDLAILGDLALQHPDFKKLAIGTIACDDQRSEKIAGLSIQEKFATVFNILVEDKEYIQEYNRFVKGMSYAPDNTLPSFEQAMEKLRKLINTILK